MKKDKKVVYKISGVILGLAALVHLVRVVRDLPLKLGSWEAPIWLSILAIIVAGYLSFHLLKNN